MKHAADKVISPQAQASVVDFPSKDENNMRFRLANENDADELATLVNQAYRGASAPGWASEVGLIEGPRTGRKALLKTIRDGTTLILVALEEFTAEILGCVSLTPGESEWYLSMLATKPRSQARGLGKSMMACAEEYAREKGASKIKISVISLRERLIEWYANQGYGMTGHTEPFPYDDPSVGTPLRPDLALVVLTKVLRK